MIDEKALLGTIGNHIVRNRREIQALKQDSAIPLDELLKARMIGEIRALNGVVSIIQGMKDEAERQNIY